MEFDFAIERIYDRKFHFAVLAERDRLWHNLHLAIWHWHIVICIRTSGGVVDGIPDEAPNPYEGISALDWAAQVETWQFERLDYSKGTRKRDGQ